jgi:ribose transport system ATP-binding protein
VSNPEPVLSIAHLSKTFTGQPALSDVELTIQPGEIRALLGQNGSGKSTLIKILAGYYRPDPGAEILIGAQPLIFGSAASAYNLGCRFVHQDLGLLPSMSVIDNLAFSGGWPTRFGTILPRESRRRAQVDLDRVGVQADPRKPVAQLSPATKTAVAVARALREDSGQTAKLLVLDEPTATLTGDEVQTLLDIIRRVAGSGVGVLYVSHRLDEVFGLADSVTVLRDGRVVVSPPLATLDHSHLVSLLVGDKLPELEAASGENLVGHGNAALEVKDLSSGLLRNVSFEARSGEIVGVAGVDGSGRERLLATVYGGERRVAGIVAHRGVEVEADRPDASMRAGVTFLPADRRAHGGFIHLAATENISISNLSPFWSRFRLRRSMERRLAREWFARLQIRPQEGHERKLATFSGGNQQKILLAKWLRCEPSVLLLEEPTQGVDIAAKVDLHQAIVNAAKAGACVVVSSSDTDELVALCHRVLVLKHGRVAREIAGPALTASEISHELLVDSSGVGVS